MQEKREFYKVLEQEDVNQSTSGGSGLLVTCVALADCGKECVKKNVY